MRNANTKPIELPAGAEELRHRIFNDPRFKDIANANSAVIGEIKQLVQTSHESQIENHNKVEKRIDGLDDRLGMLEANSDPARPGPTLASSETTAPFKTYHTNEGKIYELPSNVKLATAMPPAKQAPVCFDRWLAAFVAGEHCRDKQATEYFRDIRSQLETGTTGVLIPQEYISQWIDRIRSQMVLNAAGMTTVTMSDKVQNSSAVVTDPAATWHTESATINPGNPTFAARSLTAHTLVTRCQASLECTQDSPDFGSQLAQVMAKAMAVELDRVGLVGSGTPPEPKGILGTSGVNQITGVGAIGDYNDLLAGVRALLDDNMPLDVATGVAIMSPGVWLAYEKLATGISSDKTQLSRPQSLQNTRFLVTTNGLDVGSPATSTIFMGDFRDLVLGIRIQSSIEVLRVQTFATNLLVEFIGYLRADYMVRRPSSFVTLEGVTA